MDSDASKKLDAAAAAAIENRSASYSLALLNVCAHYMAENYVLRDVLFQKGILSPSEFDAAMQAFSKSKWDAFLNDINQKVRDKTKEYLARLEGPTKSH